MKKLLTKLFIVSMSLSLLADAKHVKIYLLTGQSNSLGTTADKKDKRAATPSKNSADSKIPFFWSNRSTRGGDGPATIIGDSGGKITTVDLRDQLYDRLHFDKKAKITVGKRFAKAVKKLKESSVPQ